MNDNIKEKIEQEAKSRYGNYQTTSLEGRVCISVFKKAAEYGYSLAQPEIEALNREVERLRNVYSDLVDATGSILKYHSDIDTGFGKGHKLGGTSPFVCAKIALSKLPTPPNNKP